MHFGINEKPTRYSMLKEAAKTTLKIAVVDNPTVV